MLSLRNVYSCSNQLKLWHNRLHELTQNDESLNHGNSTNPYVHQINIYELISVCSCPGNMRMISETAYSSQTKLIGLNLPMEEHGIGYSNLTPDPQGALGTLGVKIQVSPNQKTSLTKVVRHDKGMIKISSAPPKELGKPAKRVS